MFRTASTASALLQALHPAQGAAPRLLSWLTPSPMRLQQLDDIKALDDFLPTVIEQLQDESKMCNIPLETEWLGKLLHHTVPGGKMVRALATYNGMRELGPSNMSDEYLEKAKCLAWSVEMIQSAMALADDIADLAPERRKKVSWYTVAGPGAVFDAFLVEHSSYRLLKRHFGGDGEAYLRLIGLYVNTVFQLCFGQNHDIHCTSAGKAKFDDFSLERYRALCEFKSGEYTFYLPTATAMLACGLLDPAAHKAALDLSSDLGYIYQIQDDYLDCYGIIEHMGKQRTDIRNAKCTWVIAEAKRRANPAQLKALKANYGYDDDEKIANVVQVYQDLNMKQVFLDFEQKSFKEITDKIDKYSNVLPRALYTYALESIKYHVNR